MFINKGKLCLLLFSIILIVLFSTGSIYAEEKYVLKLGYLGPEDVYRNYEHAMAFAFKVSVEAKTNNNVEVDLYPNGILGSQEEMFEMTRNNSIQAVLPSEGVISRWYPKIQAFGIPFLYRSLPVAWAVQDGPLGDKLKTELLENTGLRVLGISDVGGMNAFATNKRPIKTAQDLKGLKIRTMAHEGHIATIKALGAAATPMPFTEVYTSLQTGVIDGHFNPVSAMVTFRMYEVQEYLSLTDHLYGAMYLMVNAKWFESLPEEYQTALLISGKEASIAARGINRIIEGEGLKFLEEKGMTIITPSADAIQEMKKKAQPVVIDMLKQKFGEDWVNEILSTVRETEAAIYSIY